ncbi:hypothetical protein PN623_00565 [Parabacteroides distasonis]|uniref:hypothetical protein n=1 Tax=Parabacteroides distasonis TaxID=823 RepID=UPI00232A8C50|nr:hypothetical protein [Parabacteroides distasonis]MDB9192830.1 hypothetical protein [Parabacteroides distasonis]
MEKQMGNRRFHSTGKGSPPLTGRARSGRRRFSGKSSSPEAPVFPRKTLHCRGADLLGPVE